MAQQTVGSIPEFTSDASPSEVVSEEVKEPVEETQPEETATPEPPAEKPAQSSEDTQAPLQDSNQDIDSLQRAVAGLQNERVKLLKEVSELKGQRREIKQDQLQRVEKQIDDLKDLHPDDVSLIDRVLRSKGYVTKEEQSKMFYEAVKQEELNKFLDKYPEYKPENDPNDTNWSALQREIGYYRLPDDPHRIPEILERAHRALPKVTSSHDITIKQRQLKVASSGSGGAQRPSSSGKTFDPEKKAMLKQGGFSDEDIRNMESRL